MKERNVKKLLTTAYAKPQDSFACGNAVNDGIGRLDLIGDTKDYRIGQGSIIACGCCY